MRIANCGRLITKICLHYHEFLDGNLKHFSTTLENVFLVPSLLSLSTAYKYTDIHCMHFLLVLRIREIISIYHLEVSGADLVAFLDNYEFSYIRRH